MLDGQRAALFWSELVAFFQAPMLPSSVPTPEPGRDAFPSYRNPFLQVQRWGYKRGLIPLSLEGVQGFGL